jgi:hypothetical protein
VNDFIAFLYSVFTVNLPLVQLFHLRCYVRSCFVFFPFITTDLVNESSVNTALDFLYFAAQSYHLDKSYVIIVKHGYIELIVSNSN